MANRVQAYWTKRAHDFDAVRRNELNNDLSTRWLNALEELLPDGDCLKILDVGTGTGFFAVILAEKGHDVCGIDLTPAMLDAAVQLADERNLPISFLNMDAQALSFADRSLDAVISRNLTWTIPDPKTAYSEWLRVLKPGGVLLNFDACYGEQVRHENGQNSHMPDETPYGHIGITDDLIRENAEITLSMPISKEKRPEWDVNILKGLGVTDIYTDADFGKKVLRELDLEIAPMFMVKAVK